MAWTKTRLAQVRALWPQLPRPRKEVLGVTLKGERSQFEGFDPLE